jgi:hypothetical protein
MRTQWVFATLSSLSLVACHRKAPPPAAQPSSGAEEIRSVYDQKGPPQPIADHLCRMLHESIELHHAACCDTKPRATFGSLCIQALSTALRDGAVKIDVAAIDRCEAALNRTFAGCEWVAAFSPPLPAECQSLLAGTLPAGGVCRSSFECASGLHCLGAGPTDKGRCVPPGPNGAPCGGSVDVLGAYVRQDLGPTGHPECQGFCNRSRCEPIRPAGADCHLDVACGPGGYCGEGHCRSGPPSKKGTPCVGGGCEPGTRCVEGTCIEPKLSGQPCMRELDCLGGCLKGDGGRTGTCGPRCT